MSDNACYFEAKDALDHAQERIKEVKAARDFWRFTYDSACKRAEKAETQVRELTEALAEIADSKPVTKSYGDYRDLFITNRDIARAALTAARRKAGEK